jgi:hypothetical protein
VPAPERCPKLSDYGSAGEAYECLLWKSALERIHREVLESDDPGGVEPDVVERIEFRDIHVMDEALTGVRDWAATHPELGWEFKVLKADTRGSWSAEGLRPGAYQVVARGSISGRQAGWHALAIVGPRKTLTVRLPRPNYLSPWKPVI